MDTSYNFKAIEKKTEEYWKTIEGKIKNSFNYEKGKPIFSFLEGPPTANAPPAVHHVEARVYKDILCRYKYMNGFTVPRKGGWDCHGLPVEVQVEKKLGLATKKDVVNYGIKNFIDRCREDVSTFINEWVKFSKKLAYWVDYDNAYVMMSNEFIESVWWSLKEIFNKGYLYEGFKVVPYCPRCETPLSSHEVALGYDDVTEEAVTVKFKLKNEDAYLLVWTTTPWTLPSNIAIAVAPNVEYVYVDNKYIIAKELAGKYFPDAKVTKRIKGKELEGKEYEPIFNYFVGKLDKPAWKIILADYVTTEEGTGLVHQAPAFGEDDYDAIKSKGMAFVNPVNKDGTFTDEVADFKGMKVKDADPKIIEWLKEKGYLFKKGKVTHTYPFCWRCKTALLYYAIDTWFIKMSQFREKLIKNNEKVNWYPEHIKYGRFGEWIANVKDWALSRSKFWGIPLNIWECSKGHQRAIGSIKELEEFAGKLKDVDLHKPYIDNVKIKCDKCSSLMTRAPDVIDVWYDSGAASFAQYHYPFENKELFEKMFPYQHIAEAIDQTRGWFYTLLAVSTLLFDKPAYTGVICAGHLIDEKGEKMSKSKGNIINPWDAFEKVGVDACRLQMCVQAPGDTKKFGYGSINSEVMPFLNVLWNVGRFADDMKNVKKDDKKLAKEDSWLLSKVNTVQILYEEAMEKREYDKCYAIMKDFVLNDLSRWYIKLIRDRGLKKDPALKYTLDYALNRIASLLAPFAPYFAEYLNLEILTNKESIHFSGWPKIEKSRIDKKLEENTALAREIVSAILYARDKVSIGVRWPLSKATVVASNKEAVKEFKSIVLEQTNVKEILFADDYPAGVKVKVRVNYASLSRFKQDIPKIVEKLFKSDGKLVRKSFEKSGKYLVDKFEIKPEDVSFEIETPKQLVAGEFPEGIVYLDTEMTPELEAEGYSRELVRNIQDLRKENNMERGEKAFVKINSSKKFENMLKKNLDYVQKTTNSKVEFTSSKAGRQFKIRDEEITIATQILTQ